MKTKTPRVKKTTVQKTSILEVPSEQDQNNCEYQLIMHFNGETFQCWTNNLQISILSFKPVEVHTEGYIKIIKGTNFYERRLPLVNMRKLFNDPQTLEIMLANLYL